MTDIRKRTGKKGTTYQVRYPSKAVASGYAYESFSTLKEARTFLESGETRKHRAPRSSEIRTVDSAITKWLNVCEKEGRARRKLGFSSLVHDSALFADVDPRQYGLALQLAEEKSRTEGFQYICCLNSGALPTKHLGELDLNLLTRLRLTDEGEEGRLLGMRLPPRDESN